MKSIFLLLVSSVFLLTSCENLDAQKAVAIGEIGLQVLQRKGVLTAEDVTDARNAGQILIKPAVPAKQPVAVQP